MTLLVAILDAGAQYSKVIDRRVRELSVESTIFSLSVSLDSLFVLTLGTDGSIEGAEGKFQAIIISGGPQSVYGKNAPEHDQRIFEAAAKANVPVLGICYGMQLMAYALGGHVEKKETREDGQFEIEVLEKESKLFQNMEHLKHGQKNTLTVLLTHGDSVTQVPKDFVVSAQSSASIIAAIENPTCKFYGVQFHPEVDLSICGSILFSNFLFDIAKCQPSYTLSNRENLAIKSIQAVAQNSKVLVLVSGGVDSSVCAALLKKALPSDQIVALHIDNGFMRLKESEIVAHDLKVIGLDLKVVNASQNFYNASTTINNVQTGILKETVQPEVKRKIIGDTFMRVADEVIKNLGLDPENVFLAQGTLRPDLIESASELASSNATVIKTHHNDTELVRILRSKGRIIEPLKDYHKDEVRLLGEALGLSRALVWRQPFPGPGLAVRLLCAEYPFIPSNSDELWIQLDTFERENVDYSFSLFPVQSVGVQGDGRSYSSLVVISSKSNRVDWSHLLRLARDIPKQLHGVNRVAFAFGKPVARNNLNSITVTHLTPDAILQLQQADDAVNSILLEYNLTKILSQVPVISIPADTGLKNHRCIVIRPFITRDFMTGVPALPGKDLPLEALDRMVIAIKQVPLVACVLYDLTGKPPGTTEWE